MAPITTSVDIARSREDVFAYIADVSRHPEWQEDLLSVTVETDGPLGPGSRMVHRRKMGSRTISIESEITTFEPPREMGFRGLGGPIRAVGSQRVEAAGDGCRVSMEMEMSGHGAGKLMLPMARRQAARQVANSHEKLKQILESPEA
jgi:uncharacterized membrane protein